MAHHRHPDRRCLCASAIVATFVLVASAWGQARPPAETSSGSAARAQTVVVKRGDTLAGLAKRLGVSVEQLRLANGRTHDLVRPGDVLVVSRAMPRVVVNKTQRTLELRFEGRTVKRYSVAVGPGTLTPTGTFTIGVKLKDPDWYHQGRRIRHGEPSNILGSRWMTLVEPGGTQHGYGIHGTTEPDSIGKAVSAGCVRMHNRDVDELFAWVPTGTSVVIRAGVTTTPPRPAATAPKDAAPGEARYWVHVVTVPATDAGRRTLSETIVFLKLRGVRPLLPIEDRRARVISLYAGTFTRDRRADAQQLAETLRAITRDGKLRFPTAAVTSIGVERETVTLIPADRVTLTGGAVVDYAVSVRIDARHRDQLARLVDPKHRDLLPLIRQTLRALIAREDPEALKAARLDRIKRQLRGVLNALADTALVDDIRFDRLTVTP